MTGLNAPEYNFHALVSGGHAREREIEEESFIDTFFSLSLTSLPSVTNCSIPYESNAYSHVTKDDTIDAINGAVLPKHIEISASRHSFVR